MGSDIVMLINDNVAIVGEMCCCFVVVVFGQSGCVTSCLNSFHALVAPAVAVVHEARAFYFFACSPKNLPCTGIIFCIHYCCVWPLCFIVSFNSPPPPRFFSYFGFTVAKFLLAFSILNILYLFI